MLMTMATSLISRSLGRAVFGLLLFQMLVPRSAAATLINDGTSADGLARMANAVNVLEEFFGPADSTLTPDNGALLAAQTGLASPPLRTVWYSADSAPTNGAYRVAADFRPADVQSVCRGGVMGWLNTGRSNGIVFQVVPAGAEPGLRVATVDFLAEDPNVNESTTNLYLLDGTPATGDYGSAWSVLGDAYVPTNFATFELTFAAPTATDTNVVSNATARVTAKVFQVDATGATNQVGTTLELLTDLPLPDSGAHALGYFAVYGSDSDAGVIGDLDNLVADNVGTRPNMPPTVQITNPPPGAVFTEPATITIEADAQDSDGVVRTVEFFAGTNSLGTVTNAPFSFTWADVTAGDYVLTARATDNRGGTTTSVPVDITVNPSSVSPPTLTVTYTPTGIILAWGVTGYQLQYTTDLGASTWTDWQVGGVPVDTRALTQITIAYSTSVQMFRLVGAGTPAGPTLSVVLAGGQITVSWPAGVTGYRLQAQTDLGGTWTDLPTSGNTYSEPATTGNRFFRLVNP